MIPVAPGEKAILGALPDNWARVSDHLTSSLGKGTVKTIRSLVLLHVVDSGHIVDRNKLFIVLLLVFLMGFDFVSYT